jgi:hypothetical protein
LSIPNTRQTAKQTPAERAEGLLAVRRAEYLGAPIYLGVDTRLFFLLLPPLLNGDACPEGKSKASGERPRSGIACYYTGRYNHGIRDLPVTVKTGLLLIAWLGEGHHAAP